MYGYNRDRPIFPIAEDHFPQPNAPVAPHFNRDGTDPRTSPYVLETVRAIDGAKNRR